MGRSPTSSLDERTVAEVKRHSLAGLDGPDLLRRTAAALRRSVPFDAYCASTVDPGSGFMTHGLAEGWGDENDQDSETARAYLDRIYFEHDLDKTALMLRERRPVALLSEETGGELDRSVRYRDLLRPLGLGHEMSGIFVDGTVWGSMDLIREAGCSDYSPREVALIRRVAPHVGAGLKVAALRSSATAAPAADDAPGVLTLDGNGRVLSSTRAAERYLAELGDHDQVWREGRALPTAVRMVAGALGQALAPAADRDRDAVPRVRTRTRTGRWLTVYGSLTEPAADQPSEHVVVIAPTQPEEIAWLNVAAYGVSPREEQVVKLVLRGLSTKQISEALYISENTVQRHLSNVFEKVGVRSRRALLKRLFFENLLPSLSGG
jgi:DNA-binding CsgD family transcriptional regulator